MVTLGNSPVVGSGDTASIQSALATNLIAAPDIPFAELHRPWGTTYMKLLRCSLSENSFINIVRWTSGVRLTTHYHAGPVYAYTLSGRWHYEEYDWVATPGTLVHETPGTVHTLVVDEPTEGLFINLGPILYLDGDRRVARVQDAQSTLQDCREALAVQGLELTGTLID